MTRQTRLNALTLLMIVAAAFSGAKVEAQCSAMEVTTGFDFPLGIAQTHAGNFVAPEPGRRFVMRSGRLPIVDPSGNRLRLVGGQPSATNDVGGPSAQAYSCWGGRSTSPSASATTCSPGRPADPGSESQSVFADLQIRPGHPLREIGINEKVRSQ